MKQKLIFLAVVLLSFNSRLSAQRSAFRTGYLRIGINTLGDDLNFNLTPKQNIFDGRYGAGTGYVFEAGRLFYFKKRSAEPTLINFGLDWTYFSLNYNKMDKWNEYARSMGGSEENVSGTKTAAAISTKLGPVISLNIIEKLVLDARFQVAPLFRFFDLNYEQNYGQPNGQYFTFIGTGTANDEDFDGESVKNRISFGVATSFGITIRRKAFGLAVDYISGKVNNYYEASESVLSTTSGKEKIPAHNLQLKLSLTL